MQALASRTGVWTVRTSGVVYDHDRGDEDDMRSDDPWTDRAVIITTPRCAACDAVPAFCMEHFGAVFDLALRSEYGK
jgi:hypothetical protein